MRELLRRSSAPGRKAALPEPGRPFLTAVAYAIDEQELLFYLHHLFQLNYIEGDLHSSELVVRPEGIHFVESLQRVGRDSEIGFCAMWFNDEVLPLWTDAIEPAITDAGFDPKRVDFIHHNNRIDDEILAWIRRSRFLIADLTGHRQGVYFEAGFAMGLGLPVVWMVMDSDAANTHFDNRQFNRIEWSYDNLAEARGRLRDRIIATIGLGPISQQARN
jgi:nucleoside 2-deoxyribosyltransferase